MSAIHEETANLRFGKLYQMLIGSIPSSILLLDPRGRITSVNENFLTRARVTEEAVLGKSMEAVIPAPLYQQMNLGHRVAEVFRTGIALRGERVAFRTPGLTTRTYYYSLIPFRWEEITENVMLLMEDITEQVRLGEEANRSVLHLASVIESASDIVLSMSNNGRILTWNTAGVRITGFEVTQVVARHFTDLFENTTSKERAKTLLKEASSGNRVSPEELELADKSGRILAISWVFSAMRSIEGLVVGLVAVGRNLTEQRKLEAQLMQSERLASLGVMAGGIAHEVRNPLAVVSTAAQLLLQKSLTPELQLECSERIYRNVQRASDIIENLLRFARPSAKGPMERLNLVKVVRDSLSLVENQLRLAKIDIQFRLLKDSVWVRGNSSLLEQLITNILLNSVNAMPNGSISHMDLALGANRNQAVLVVTDTGKGIPKEDIAKVFDPFFTTMPVGQGTGLGLSICYAIVQQHEGKIEITSNDGKGTTVTIYLPLDLERGRP